MMQKIETFMTICLRVLLLILFGVLLMFAITMSGVNRQLFDEYIYYQSESVIGNLFKTGLLVLVIFLTFFLADLLEKRAHIALGGRKTALAVSFLVTGLCIFWALQCNTTTQGDQLEVAGAAVYFNDHDYTYLGEGGYAALFPHQWGMILLLRVCFKFFGAYNYTPFWVLSAIASGCMVYFSYEIAMHVSKQDRRVGICLLGLMATCVPLYFYTMYVYGDQISLAPVLLAAWMLLSCMERFSWQKALIFGAACAGAMVLRRNSLIFLIAFSIIILWRLFQKETRKRALVLFVSMLVFIFISNAALNQYYESKRADMGQALPTILFVAMGFNWDQQNAGWYNGYIRSAYAAVGYEPEAASAAAKETIKEAISYFMENPSYTLAFYKDKFLSQWEVPLYQCIAMNNGIAGEQGSLAALAYSDAGRDKLYSFMNYYQILLYGSVFLLLLLMGRRWRSLEPYMLLIVLLGGFLFTMLWEAKSRYVLPYLYCMIPYGAVCMGLLYEKVLAFIARLRQKTQVAR